MDSHHDRLGYRINRVRSLASEANLDHALFVLDQQPYRFPAKLPHLGELADAIVALEGRVLERH
jgi:hypothetical protein